MSVSEDLNQLAQQWAQKMAISGEEKKNDDSKYGQLVCSHNKKDTVAEECAVKWYSSIKFFDWADPKVTEKALPFIQMVWKNSTLVGVGIAVGNGGVRKQNIAGKFYAVVLFDPGMDTNGKLKENVLPATGESRCIRF